MSEHLNDQAVAVVAAGDATPEQLAHARDCGLCAERLTRTRALLLRLDSLPESETSPRGMWAKVLSRTGRGADGDPPRPAFPDSLTAPAARSRGVGREIRSPRPLVRGGLRAAAAAVLFLSGMALQAALERNPVAESGAPGPPYSANALPGTSEAARAAEIQRAGTEYVTAIARLAEAAPGMPAKDVGIARQVAYAAILGATHELAALDGADPAAPSIHEQARTAWVVAGERGDE